VTKYDDGTVVQDLEAFSDSDNPSSNYYNNTFTVGSGSVVQPPKHLSLDDFCNMSQ